MAVEPSCPPSRRAAQNIRTRANRHSQAGSWRQSASHRAAPTNTPKEPNMPSPRAHQDKVTKQQKKEKSPPKASQAKRGETILKAVRNEQATVPSPMAAQINVPKQPGMPSSAAAATKVPNPPKTPSRTSKNRSPLNKVTKASRKTPHKAAEAKQAMKISYVQAALTGHVPTKAAGPVLKASGAPLVPGAVPTKQAPLPSGTIGGGTGPYIPPHARARASGEAWPAPITKEVQRIPPPPAPTKQAVGPAPYIAPRAPWAKPPVGTDPLPPVTFAQAAGSQLPRAGWPSPPGPPCALAGADVVHRLTKSWESLPKEGKEADLPEGVQVVVTDENDIDEEDQKYPAFNPKLHKMPRDCMSLEELLERKKKGSGYKLDIAKLRKEIRGSRHSDKKKITILWLEREMNGDDKMDERDIWLRNRTEGICRAQADDLKLNHIIIRRGIHATRNKFINGEQKYECIWDETKKYMYWKKRQRPADWHITVWAGHSKDHIVLCGHIYVVWDGQAWDQDIAKVTDPKKQRKIVLKEYGDRCVADEWWCVAENVKLEPLNKPAEDKGKAGK